MVADQVVVCKGAKVDVKIAPMQSGDWDGRSLLVRISGDANDRAAWHKALKTDLVETQKLENELERERCKHCLSQWLPPGSRVYTLCRGVMRNGISRRYSLYCVGEEERIYNITYYVAKVLGYSMNDEGLKTDSGAFDIVNVLSYRLHGFPRDWDNNPSQRVEGYRAGYTLQHDTL